MSDNNNIAEAAVIEAIETLIAIGKRARSLTVPMQAEQILIGKGQGRISPAEAGARVKEAIIAMAKRGAIKAYAEPYKDWTIVDEASVETEPRTNDVWDVFVCHASEDKEDFVRRLANGLQEHGLKVWFDEFTLTVGDSLRRSIDRGLAASRFSRRRCPKFAPDFRRSRFARVACHYRPMGVRTRSLDMIAAMRREAADRAARDEAARVVERRNKAIAAGPDMWWSPTIRAAIVAGMPCPGCRTSRAIDLRTIDRHPLASVDSLVLGLRCAWCRGAAPMPKITGLHAMPPVPRAGKLSAGNR